MPRQPQKQSIISAAKPAVILAVVCLIVPTAYLIRTMFDSYQKADHAGDLGVAIELGEADAKSILRSGRKALVAHCLQAHRPTYPLLESMKNADCIKKSLQKSHCETICLGGRIRNDYIDHSVDPWRDYEPKDHDPRNTEAYAVAFNNVVLNSLADNHPCFTEFALFDQE